LDVAHDITTDTTYERFYEVKRSWFSRRVTDIIKTSVDETANPSDISGRSVSIGAGGNLNIVGSLVMADGAVGLHADHPSSTPSPTFQRFLERAANQINDLEQPSRNCVVAMLG
jgi:hypothetical protein